MKNWQKHPWMGVSPATLYPFHETEEEEQDHG